VLFFPRLLTSQADEAFTESIATPADHETQLVEKIATDATEHTRDRGWKVLLEPYTVCCHPYRPFADRRSKHGSLWAISLTLFAGSWGFSVPAAVLLFIQADIGPCFPARERIPLNPGRSPTRRLEFLLHCVDRWSDRRFHAGGTSF